MRTTAEIARTNFHLRTRESRVVHPLVSKPPNALFELAGRRILMTIAQVPVESPDPGRPRHFAEQLAFLDRLAMAAHLATLDLEVVLVGTGRRLNPADALAMAHVPGISFCTEFAVTPPEADPVACSADLARIACTLGADILFLHEPALAAARSDPRPTFVSCDSSRFLRRARSSAEAPLPHAQDSSAALHRLGLHAADRVIVASQTLGDMIAAENNLASAPITVPPVFRRPVPRDQRHEKTTFILAGSAHLDPGALGGLDRAAGRIYGAVILLDPGAQDAGNALCLEQIHRLAPLSPETGDALLLRAAAFYCPSALPEFEPLVLRAAGAGCPLILPDTRLNREFWHDAAHFLPAGSEDALAAALRRMTEDQDHRRRLAAAGIRRARALAAGSGPENLHAMLASTIAAMPLTVAG